MQYSSAILLAAFAVTQIAAHGVITEVRGANGKQILFSCLERFLTSSRCRYARPDSRRRNTKRLCTS